MTTPTDPLTPTPARRLTVGTIISSVMIALGLFIFIRLFLRLDAPLTGTALLDIAFGLFFVGRGAIHFLAARRRARG